MPTSLCNPSLLRSAPILRLQTHASVCAFACLTSRTLMYWDIYDSVFGLQFMPVVWGSSALSGDVLPVHVPVSQDSIGGWGIKDRGFFLTAQLDSSSVELLFLTLCHCIRSSSCLSVVERFSLPDPPSFPDPCKRESLFLSLSSPLGFPRSSLLRNFWFKG